jgi:hypothetical protein
MQSLDPTDPQYINKIAQRNPKLAIELQKGQLDFKKGQADLEANLMKNARNTLAPINDQGTYDLWRQQTSAQLPGLSKFLPAKFDDKVKTSLMLEADKYIQQTQISASQQQTANVSIRGQDLTAATARRGQDKPQFSIEAGGWVYPPSASPTNVPAAGATTSPNAPAGAAPTSALTSKFVPVEGITPKPTEDQAKTNSNINRIVIAAKSMSKVLKDNPKALAPTGTETLAQATPLWEGASAPLTNLTRSADRQIVSSGYADIIDALLYLSTGAAYNKEQLAAQREAFLPAWSDKEANKIEKVAKLQDLVRMAKTRTGKAWTPELEKATQQLLPANLTSEAVPDTTKSGATKSNW